MMGLGLRPAAHKQFTTDSMYFGTDTCEVLSYRQISVDVSQISGLRSI
jgi:hypothetical protein